MRSTAPPRPTPTRGRVASRRLNRVEYVNVIEDLLGLEVNGEELLPSDMAGFGFDNNADVLSITPGLMARYIAGRDQDQPGRGRQPRHPPRHAALRGGLRAA